jgi:cell division initiation protein
MRITPTAIRQTTFETSFRGYEKKEVAGFLEEMSVVVEQMHQETMELKSRLQMVESEAKRLKDVEDSLFRALKTAEDAGAGIITEANDAAEQIIAEANQYAEETTNNANRYAEQKTKEADRYAEQLTKEVNLQFQKAQKQAEEQARIITSAAEAKAKETLKEIRESMQSLVRSYEGLLEQREALVKSLKRLSQDALNQIELSDAHFFRVDARAHQRAIEELSRSSHFSVANISNLTTQSVPPLAAEPEEQFEDDMSGATLDEETQETIEALEHELEEMIEEEVLHEIHVQEVVPEVNNSEEDPVGEVMDEPTIEPEKAKEEEDASPQQDDPKKQSGSFFDQFG